MVRLARDVTAATAVRSALVLAPHPDDETLGCGATILRKVAAGATVTLVVVTDGRHSHRGAGIGPGGLAELRRGELAEAAKRLRLPAGAVRWAGFEDGALSAREPDLTRAVQHLVDELRPDEVYATSALEPHPDHAALGRAARAAAGPAVLFEYPVWLWRSWPLQRGARLRSTVDAAVRVAGRGAVKVRTGEYLAGKLHALDAHDSQLRRPARLPDSVPWAVLPQSVLDAAAAPAELFFLAHRDASLRSPSR